MYFIDREGKRTNRSTLKFRFQRGLIVLLCLILGAACVPEAPELRAKRVEPKAGEFVCDASQQIDQPASTAEVSRFVAHGGRFRGGAELAVDAVVTGEGAGHPHMLDPVWLDASGSDAPAAMPELIGEAMEHTTREGLSFWEKAEVFLVEHIPMLGDLVPDEAGLGIFSGWSVDVEPFAQATSAQPVEQACWLASRFVRPFTCEYEDGLLLPDKLDSELDPACNHRAYSYPDPIHFDELQDRATRTYCAAVEAFEAQPESTTRMGRQAAASINLLGKRIDFLRFEPTLAMAPPARFLGEPDDGARAYALNFTAGSRIQPISILPSFPEFRVPVGYVTADGEVAMGALPGAIQHPDGEGGLMHSDANLQDWRVVTHGEAFSSGHKSFELRSPSFELMKVGTFFASMRIGMNLEIGTPERVKERLLADAPPSWGPARSGDWTGADHRGIDYNDGPWELSDYAPEIGDRARVTALSESSAGVTELHDWSPFLTRALQNNDSGLNVATGVGLSAHLSAGAGVTFPSFKAGLSVTGGLTGVATQTHEFLESEQLLLEPWDLPDYKPATGFTVAPSVGAELALLETRMDLMLSFKAPLVGWLSHKLNLLTIDRLPIAEWESGRWPEDRRLRIGTAEDRGGVLKTGHMSQASFHWPGQDPADSFPEDIEACLEAAPPVGDLPAPCDPVIDEAEIDEIPSAEICAFLPQYWTHEFFPIPLNTEARIQCVEDYREFLKDPAGVHWDGAYSYDWFATGERYPEPIDSRIIDFDDPEVAQAYGDVLSSCAVAFDLGGGDLSLLDQFIFAGICDSDGRPMSEEEVLSYLPGGSSGAEIGDGVECREPWSLPVPDGLDSGALGSSDGFGLGDPGLGGGLIP